ALPILLLASNAPDADVVSSSGGALSYIEHHRGITHTLLGAPVVAAVLVLLVSLIGRKPIPWVRGVVTATAGVIVHLLLDWTNTYGIRFLLPFTGEWFRLDITNVIDAWIFGALLLAVAGPWLAGLVSSEIGAKPGTGRGAAIAVLVFLLLYEGA